MAFHDALADTESAVRELGDETLKKLATELTERLRTSPTVDWHKRESVRARLRILIRRLLRRYKYPPDPQAAAVDLALVQAETLADSWAPPSSHSPLSGKASLPAKHAKATEAAQETRCAPAGAAA